MNDHRDGVPGYQTVRMGLPKTPVASLADTDAWRARRGYPEIRFAGGPAFGVAREREEGGWELHPFFGAPAPQDARDSMGSHFRKLAGEREAAGDQPGYRECMAAAERMEWEAVDEVAVLGTRYRVVRADQFLRSGPDGPEPPRPTDPDPGDSSRGREALDPAAGFVIDPLTATGLSEGILKLELLSGNRKRGTVPDDVYEDSVRASVTHPGGVLLPVAFLPGERVNGQWGPVGIQTSPSPQCARDTLAGYLRVTFPWELRLDSTQRAVYAEAADRLDRDRADDLTVSGRHFRIVRVERLIRIGPDGPERPRPSDPDPQPPVMVQAQQLRDQGLLTDDEDENAPIELDEDGQRFLQLFLEDEQRRRARLRER